MANHEDLQRRRSAWRDVEGSTSVEYAVIIGLIVAVCISAVATLTQATRRSFEDSSAAISGAIGGG
jgi:pilus assembly protein Flp/PilA